MRIWISAVWLSGCLAAMHSPKAREFDRQVAEFQARIAVLNGFTALGIPVTKVAR